MEDSDEKYGNWVMHSHNKFKREEQLAQLIIKQNIKRNIKIPKSTKNTVK